MTTLTARNMLVLAYVIEHPGTTARQAADALDVTTVAALRALEVLYVQRLVARQFPLRGVGSIAPATWWAEDAALSAYETAQNKVGSGC